MAHPQPIPSEHCTEGWKKGTKLKLNTWGSLGCGSDPCRHLDLPVLVTWDKLLLFEPKTLDWASYFMARTCRTGPCPGESGH